MTEKNFSFCQVILYIHQNEKNVELSQMFVNQKRTFGDLKVRFLYIKEFCKEQFL